MTRRWSGEEILWGVRWYVAYPMSYRQLEETMEERGVEVEPIPLPSVHSPVEEICGRTADDHKGWDCVDDVFSGALVHEELKVYSYLSGLWSI